jgi:hypothetical protein
LVGTGDGVFVLVGVGVQVEVGVGVSVGGEVGVGVQVGSRTGPTSAVVVSLGGGKGLNGTFGRIKMVA